MGRQGVGHSVRLVSQCGLVVVGVSVEMLHVLCSARTLELLVGRAVCISLVVEVTEEVEASLVSPEVLVLVAYHHAGSLAAAVLFVLAAFRAVERVGAESEHKVVGWTAPSAPEIAGFGESFAEEVGLESVLTGPLASFASPHPADERLTCLVVN